jgi:WD40 repeat protein
VATAAYDQTVRLWNMNAVDPASKCAVLAGHRGQVQSILFSTDGRRLITGGDDGTACVWDLEASDPTSAPVILRGHCGPIAALAVTPDGRKILTGCSEASDQTDCLVRLWDLPIKEVLEKARPVIARRMNAAEQEQLLLETANRPSDQGQPDPDLQ